jgi:hypothetical protein
MYRWRLAYILLSCLFSLFTLNQSGLSVRVVFKSKQITFNQSDAEIEWQSKKIKPRTGLWLVCRIRRYIKSRTELSDQDTELKPI